MMRRTNRNNNQSATAKEMRMARRKQYMILRNHALRNEQYFLAEYYENMGKATR